MIKYVEACRCRVRTFLPLAAIVAAPAAQIGVEAMALAVGLPVEQGGDDVKSMPRRSPTAYRLVSSTGRFRSTTQPVAPRIDSIQPASSSVFDTVAGQTHQLHLGRQVEHDLFPDRSSKVSSR